MRIPKVRVDIEYLPQKNNITSIDFHDTYSSSSAVQSAEYTNQNYVSSPLATISQGQDMFLLGRSKLGTGAVYIDKYDGYLSTILSTDTLYDVTDSSKGYKIGKNAITGASVDDLTITIKSLSEITQLVFFFDSVVYEYPVVISVDGEIFINQSTRFAWSKPENMGTEVVVKFLSWNVPNAVLRVTGVVDGLTIGYDKNNGLVNVDVQFQSTASEMPEYGCTGKVDSFTILDNEYYVHSLAEMGLLKKDIAIKVYFGDKLISEYKSTADWDAQGKRITVQMEDEIMRWDEISVDLSDEDKGKNLKEYLLNVFRKGKIDIDNRISYSYWQTIDGVDYYMDDYLEKIQLGIWYHPQQDTLRAELDKICALAQFNIYIGLENKIVISKG